MMEKLGLTPSSEPWEFAEAFIPLNNVSNQALKKNYFSFENLSKWTNEKAWLAGMKDWKPFDAREIRQHFGFYVLHGLSPTPRVEYNFKPQKADRVAGNDFVYSSFDALSLIHI